MVNNLKITGFNWLKKQITQLEATNSKFKDIIAEINKIKPGVYNEFREWTPLKLILLNYALNVCSIIVNRMPFFKNKYYIDLFAGSGVNKMKGSEDDFLIGSPLIASLNYSNIYNSLIFCEKEPSYHEALNLRLKILKLKNLEIKDEYEKYLDDIIKKVNNKNIYSFFFIDPYATEFSWESMKKVLKVRSDIIFTFMCTEIFRVVGLYKAGLSDGTVLTKLFGDETWKKAKNAEELVDIYKTNILKERLDAPIRTIKVKSSQFNFCYYMFFITNKTKGENKWLRAIDRAKKEIETNSDKAVMNALDIIKKRQSDLNSFSN